MQPRGQGITRAIDVVKAICVTVRCLIGMVQPLNHLFKWAVFCRNSIVVGKSNELCDLECKIFSEFHCSEKIGIIAVNNELKVFRLLCKSLECHTHDEDARTDAMFVRHLIADDRSGHSAHNEPDVGFDTTDFYVGFIDSELHLFFIVVLINKRLDVDSDSLAVVGDLLVGNADVVQVFQSLQG